LPPKNTKPKPFQPISFEVLVQRWRFGLVLQRKNNPISFTTVLPAEEHQNPNHSSPISFEVLVQRSRFGLVLQRRKQSYVNKDIRIITKAPFALLYLVSTQLLRAAKDIYIACTSLVMKDLFGGSHVRIGRPQSLRMHEPRSFW
jgi:hypothetical protein